MKTVQKNIIKQDKKNRKTRIYTISILVSTQFATESGWEPVIVAPIVHHTPPVHDHNGRGPVIFHPFPGIHSWKNINASICMYYIHIHDMVSQIHDIICLNINLLYFGHKYFDPNIKYVIREQSDTSKVILLCIWPVILVDTYHLLVTWR